MTAYALLFAAVFLAWAWTLLAAVIDTQRRARRHAPGLFVPTRAEWAGIGEWRRDPARAGQRRRLLGLTVALLAMVVVWEAVFDEPPAEVAAP